MRDYNCLYCCLANATYTGDAVLGEEGNPQVRLHNYNLDWMDFRGYNIRIATDARTCDTMTETDYGDIDGGIRLILHSCLQDFCLFFKHLL
jgi:hypothetical protein